MPWRLAVGIGVWYSTGYRYGINEIPALQKLKIANVQYPAKMLVEMSVSQRLSLGVQEIVYHPYDVKAYISSGPVETVEDDVIHVRHPNLTERYTIPEVVDYIRQDAKQEFALLNDEADRAQSALLKIEDNEDPDYLNWVQYDADLAAAQMSLKQAFGHMITAEPPTAYDQWVHFARTWRNDLPSKPEMVSFLTVVVL